MNQGWKVVATVSVIFLILLVIFLGSAWPIVPYTVTEAYTEQETHMVSRPYTDTEVYQVPYEATETYTAYESYNYTVECGTYICGQNCPPGPPQPPPGTPPETPPPGPPQCTPIYCTKYCTEQGIQPVTKERTVTRFRDATRTVTKYREVPETYTVTKYRTVTRYRPAFSCAPQPN